MPIPVGHGRTTPKPEQFDTVLAEGANIIHLQSAVPSKAVDKSKLN
jgi:hypothetical protein